jgi:hypothetical protein
MEKVGVLDATSVFGFMANTRDTAATEVHSAKL